MKHQTPENIVIDTEDVPGSHGCIAALASKFDGPFEQPIVWDRNTGEMQVAQWMIKIYKLTKTGNISKAGGGYLTINYCPLCGEKLEDEEEQFSNEKYNKETHLFELDDEQEEADNGKSTTEASTTE